MNEELEDTTEEVLEVETNNVKKQLTTVTTFSKYLALALFISLPFIGGWVGYHYAPEKIVEVEKMVEVVQEVENIDTNDKYWKELASSFPTAPFDDSLKEGGEIISFCFKVDRASNCIDEQVSRSWSYGPVMCFDPIYTKDLSKPRTKIIDGKRQFYVDANASTNGGWPTLLSWEIGKTFVQAISPSTVDQYETSDLEDSPSGRYRYIRDYQNNPVGEDIYELQLEDTVSKDRASIVYKTGGEAGSFSSFKWSDDSSKLFFEFSNGIWLYDIENKERSRIALFDNEYFDYFFEEDEDKILFTKDNCVVVGSTSHESR